MILKKNYFILIYGCNIVRFLLLQCKWLIILCGQVVTFGSLNVSMVTLTFVQKCSNNSL